jgi:hypothetical protein
MASLVGRNGWAIIRNSVHPCTITAQNYKNASVTVLLVDGERRMIEAQYFTTQLDTANEWRVDFCGVCRGDKYLDAGGEMVRCPHCEPIEV